MASMLEQQKQITKMMEKLAMGRNNNKSSGGTSDSQHKCSKCGQKAHPGRVSDCWDDPKNASKRTEWYLTQLKRKAKRDREANEGNSPNLS